MRPAALARLLLLLPSIAFFLAAGPASAQEGAAGSLAVVDLERLYEECELTKAGHEDLAAFRSRMEQRLLQLQARGKELTDELSSLAPQVPRAEELRLELRSLDAQFQALQQQTNAEINLRVRRLELRFYRVAREAVNKVAQEKRLGLVLRKAQPVPNNVDTNNADAVRAVMDKLAQQPVLFADPAFDITTDVLLRMNEMFRAGNTGDVAPPPANGQQNNATTRPAGAPGAQPGAGRQ